MICQRCLRSLQTRSISSTRFFSASSTRGEAVPSPENASSHPTPQSRPARIRSSARAGTVLKGINFEKNKPDPIAKADSEYPDWLWSLLDRQSSRKGDQVDKTDDAGLYSKNKRERKMTAKALQEAESRGAQPKIPSHEHSIDLPSGEDGSFQSRKEAFESRATLTKNLRQKRRSDIKESNYLRTMR